MTREAPPDATARSLTRLLSKGAPETRAAAALVLGALNVGGASADRALLAAARQGPQTLRPYARDALARRRSPVGLGHLASLLAAEGPSRDQAIRLLPLYGAAAWPSVRRASRGASIAATPAFLEAAIRTGAPESAHFVCAAAVDAGPAKLRTLHRALSESLPAFGAAARGAWGRALAEFLERVSDSAGLPVLLFATKLLRRIKAPAAFAALLKLASQGSPPALRKNAFAALHAAGLRGSDRAAARAAAIEAESNPATPSAVAVAAGRLRRAPGE